MIRVVLGRALRGDLRAAAFLFDRLLGRVPLRIENLDDWTPEDPSALESFL